MKGLFHLTNEALGIILLLTVLEGLPAYCITLGNLFDLTVPSRKTRHVIGFVQYTASIVYAANLHRNVRPYIYDNIITIS